MMMADDGRRHARSSSRCGLRSSDVCCVVGASLLALQLGCSKLVKGAILLIDVSFKFQAAEQLLLASSLAMHMLFFASAADST
jgi:hypothetical protein